MDFTGNTERIINSILCAKRAHSRYRLGPELELSGYGCEDHFSELDTYTHSWQCVAKILHQTNINSKLQDIVCDIGLPVLHGGVAYNCRILLLNGRVLLIRPKLVLADGGLHRETRWFTAWPHRFRIVNFVLPLVVRQVSRNFQETAPFGDAILRFCSKESSNSFLIGLETCEELWIGTPPHISMYACGADAVLNASASHHELRKLDRRIELVKAASRSNGGGLYAYTNLRGCDSERICYDGCALVAVSGQLICQTKQFGLGDILVETITVNVNTIRSRRIADRCFGRAAAAAAISDYPIIEVDFSVCQNIDLSRGSMQNFSCPNILCPEEEIAQGPTLWLWDMLRRSKSSGFFLCLSGGLDSASVACLVYLLCVQILEAINEGIEPVLRNLRCILGESDNYLPGNAHELCSRLLSTSYLSTEHSSTFTRSRAKRLAEAVGSHHIESDISSIVSELVTTASGSLNLLQSPRFSTNGGTNRESLALQNVQARTRLVMAYMMAQLIPWQSQLPGNLLVLSSANLDECLRGYLTKYDCSSADINPIGSISKLDLRRFIAYCIDTIPKYMDHARGSKFAEVLKEILTAPPTAELTPLFPDGQIQQTDETEMGLSYAELSLFGRLRKIESCGPYSMLLSLLDGNWKQIKNQIPKDCFTDDNSPNIALGKYLSDKVKLFFKAYAINRHKATVLPPAYHAEVYSADDNRFDLRPCLYPSDWDHQFQCLDSLVAQWEKTFN